VKQTLIASVAASASLLVSFAGCGGSGTKDISPGGTGGGGGPAVTRDPHGCPDLFAQDRLPTYDVELSAEEWAKLQDEFHNRAAREAAGLDINPYHSIIFRYGEEQIDNALIRLKGKSSWRQAIALDNPAKMQFVIAFNEVDPKGRFHGVRKIELDMPRNDETFLRQRLSLAYLREVGVPAQCVNNGRLNINGAYYGVYTNMERLDKEFLQRVFPEASDGDLWEAGRRLRTNETTADRTRRNLLYKVTDATAMAQLVDMEQALAEWAAEAVMPDGDGYYGGTHNYFLYDHPLRGFLWLPHDKDAGIGYRRFDINPIFWWDPDEDVGLHYRLAVVADPMWRARYVAAIERALAGYDIARLQGQIDAWSAQIADAVREDPNKRTTIERHQEKVAEQRAFVAKRAEFVRNWLGCMTGKGKDGDGDGAKWCEDCNDADSQLGPAAAEICDNMLDENCSGHHDEGCPLAAP